MIAINTITTHLIHFRYSQYVFDDIRSQPVARMEREKNKLNESEDFANIDDLLDDQEEEKLEVEKTDITNPEDVKIESSISLDDNDDGIDNDRPENDLHISVPLVPKKEEGGPEDRDNVFASGLLDDLLSQKMEVAKRAIFPINLAMEGISDVSAPLVPSTLSDTLCLR